MQVLKIEAEGAVTSFRYPHFMWQTQPTFEMPPPTTIYGHICSAVGEWIEPRGLEFGYHFTFAAKFEDLEHIHAGNPATIVPFSRELLFRPRLVLYLNQPDLLPAFRSPRYAVVLGRSQDLFTYRRIEVVTLEQRDCAYFEHTLLPSSMEARSLRGVVVLMPRYVDYHARRAPTFARYVVLRDRVRANADEDEPDVLRSFTGDEHAYWVDPTAPAHPRHPGFGLGIPLHRFVD